MQTYTLPVQIDDLQYYKHPHPLQLESGIILPQLTIGYHTFGTLSKTRDNAIWICHALTASSDVREWWGDLLGPGKLFDTDKYFIVCANMLGSCYGSTGPRSFNPKDNVSYGLQFPAITMRDITKAHLLLLNHLNIDELVLLTGGSCGGHQCLEMAIAIPEQVNRLGLLVTSARETAWAIAIHEAGRMALTTDPSFRENYDRAGAAGLKTARGQAMLIYRTVQSYIDNQSDTDDTKIDSFKAASYISHQGTKLERRFYAHAYFYLLNALDSHNIGRGRSGIEAALQGISIPTTIIGIESDMLIPVSQQEFMAQHMPNAKLEVISSKYGHDGFLLETEQIENIMKKALGDH